MGDDVHQNFVEKLILSWWRYCSNVMAIFTKNDVIFDDVTEVQILYICLFFDTAS